VRSGFGYDDVWQFYYALFANLEEKGGEGFGKKGRSMKEIDDIKKGRL